MAIDPGRMRHLVTIREPGSRTGGSYGTGTFAWPVFLAGVWAHIEPLEGFERIQAMQVSAGVTHRVTMRYVEGVTSKMRIDHEGRLFAIVAPPINEEERGRWLTLLCRELEE